MFSVMASASTNCAVSVPHCSATFFRLSWPESAVSMASFIAFSAIGDIGALCERSFHDVNLFGVKFVVLVCINLMLVLFDFVDLLLITLP